MTEINVIHDVKTMKAESEKMRNAGESIAFVPTMGYLHQGHLSLVKKAGRLCDRVVASIFVNPVQFGPSEDFAEYPRDFDRDLRLLSDEGVAVVFNPDEKALYPQGFQTGIVPGPLSRRLCGLSRPAFLKGAATVVAKLFNIVKPHAAIFGEKDWQQLQIIRRMTRDLNMDVEIVGAPIVREDDGLAMSSRNAYIDPGDRNAALSLFKAIKAARELVARGVVDAWELREKVRKIIEQHPINSVDYISICHPDTLDDVESVESRSLLALAVNVGGTRLIDNIILERS